MKPKQLLDSLRKSNRFSYRESVKSGQLSYLSVFTPKSIGKIAFLVLLCGLFLTDCGTNHFLKEDEYLVKKNSIRFENDQHLEKKGDITTHLEKLYKQNKNTNFFLFFPREWFYFKTNAPGDTTSWDRFRRKYIGEAPSIYSDSLSLATAEAMKFYLMYSGYFEASVLYEKKLKRHKANVEYIVDPGRLFVVDSLSYSSKDVKVDSLLQLLKPTSLLKEHSAIDLGVADEEKIRIGKFLRNHGYAHFYTNYFDQLEIDTFQNEGKGNLYLSILSPNEDSIHQVFHIGRIDVFPDFDLNVNETTMEDTLIQGVHIHWRDSIETIDPKVLLDAIDITPGGIYQQGLVDRTNKHLSALRIYRFARVKSVPDIGNPNVLNFRIELTANPKMELGTDLEFTYTNRGATSGVGNLIGLQLSPSFLNRNIFGGAELLSSNFSFGAEFGLKEKNKLFANTLDFGTQWNLYLPKFLDYFGFWKSLNKIPFGKNKRVLANSFYESLKENANTRISARYNYVSIQNWYKYHFLNASYGYDFVRSPTQRYFINHIGVDFFNPVIDPVFQRDVLDKEENTFLRQSFGQQVFVSLLFRNIDYIFNSRPKLNGSSTYLGLSFEMAGTEIWGVNALYNEFALKSDTFRLAQDVEFSQYFKIESDFRYLRKIRTNDQLAFRLIFGISRPFGFTSDVPYVKQFYVGGANSIRAWAPRGLGPGGYVDSLSLDPTNRTRLYQTGDFRFEFNLEWRFDIIWFLKGAVFLDGGNVWSLREDLNRVGAQFLFKQKHFPESNEWSDPFYKQIALGTGLGLRFDFSYFIFRLDAGVKLKNNYPGYRDETGLGHDYWRNFQESIRFNNMTYNLSLGYPF